MKTFGLRRSLRLRSERAIERLFAEREITAAHYPVRMVACRAPEGGRQEVLFSVSKKKLHRAVDRNRAKRQMREAFRLNRALIGEKRLHIALLWMASEPVESARVARAVVALLEKLGSDE